MKTSTEYKSTVKHVGHEKAIEYIAKAGFDAFDFSMAEMADYDGYIVPENGSPLRGNEYLKFVRHLRHIAEDNGIHCNQSHAPDPSYIPEVSCWFNRAIECTAEMGGKICVIHPDNYKGPEENAEMFIELLPFAKEHGVKIAVENMWNYDLEAQHVLPAACSHHDDFLAHIKAVNDDYLVACVDVGHAEIQGLNTSAVQMIRTLGSHVQALHLHDTDRINDNHQVPFSMNIDFEAIVRALKDVDYKGYFTLESAYYMYDLNPVDVWDGVCHMAKAARRLADMFDAL